MLEHISHLRSLHDQLKKVGVSIDDTELAMTLLVSACRIQSLNHCS